MGKKYTSDITIVDFTKAFDSIIHRGKMEQIQLAYGLPKKKNRSSYNDSL